MNNNQTMKNMELILKNMKTETLRGNFNSLKTLSNSYHTLIQQMFMMPDEFKNEHYMDNLEEQHQILVEIKTILEEQSIPALLSNECYSEVNSITTTTTRIYNSLGDITKFLERYVYPKYRKRVVIYALSESSAMSQVKKLIEESEEAILEERHMPRRYTAITKSNSYTALKYDENYNIRGHRYDRVYIDRGLQRFDVAALDMTNPEVEAHLF